MPKVSMSLPEVEQSVSRPIIYDIIEQVSHTTKLPKVPIYFSGDSGVNRTPGTEIGKTDHSAVFESADRLWIEVEHDYDIETISATSIDNLEHTPVFADVFLGTYIVPIYGTVNVTVNFKYSSLSKTTALRWRDEIRYRISALQTMNLHSITYHYPLPKEYLSLIEIIHELRENNEGYGQSYAEYVNSCASSRLTLASDIVAKSTRLIISETQTRIIGQYDFDAVPEKIERDSATGTYVISFGYKFSYDRPLACNMVYPIMVHNQLLPTRFVEFMDKAPDWMKRPIRRSHSNNALASFESDNQLTAKVDVEQLLRMPSYDDFLLETLPKGCGAFALGLIEVDEADKRSLFNLKDMGDYCIDEDILEFIEKSEYRYIGKLYQSVIHVPLFRNKNLTSSGMVVCDGLLNLKTAVEVNLRDQHRIALTLTTDLTLLRREAIDRLLQYPKAFVKIIGAINEILKSHPRFVDLGDKYTITPLEFSPIYRAITGYGYDSGLGVNGGHYYGPGRNIYDGIHKDFHGDLFDDIDPIELTLYRNNRKNMMTVMRNGLIALRK